MKHFPLSKLTCLLATLLSLVLMTTQVASAAPVKDETWKIVNSPNGSLPNSVFFDVAAISKHDVWAVGGTFIGSGTPGTNLIEHWNGTRWSLVPSPNPVPNDILFAVAAVSANDIWASGTTFPNGITAAKLQIEHWNGSQWSIVPSPNVGTQTNSLNGVTVVSANNVWAVGAYNDSNNILHTLIEHWNGRRWSVVNSPNVGSNGSLLGTMSAISAHDIWTVGFNVLANGNMQTLIEHWNGSQWSVVPSPNIGSGSNSLGAIAADSAGDVWAVGSYTASTGFQQTLIEHCC